MLVLASNSPRRKQLMTLAGWTFETLTADIDENHLPGEPPQDYVMRLAEAKARRAAARAPVGSVIVGDVNVGDIIVAADTTVVDGSAILGKPADEIEAEAMLRRLRNRTHQVFTALAVLRPSDGTLRLECCSTDVPMRDYSDEEIRNYIATGDPMDKAGAYGIQHAGFHPAENFQGCFANVMGLPVCLLSSMLNEFGLHSKKDAPLQCQGANGKPCAIYTEWIESSLRNS
jgi:MAF protein